MQRALTIVHTSDVHLDSRGEAAEAGFRSRAESAFASVVDTALAEAADLLLIAGDLFDNNRVDDSNIDFVYRQFERLGASGGAGNGASATDRPPCQVVMLPGNHDVHDRLSVWNRFDFAAAGEHVHGLMSPTGEFVELPHVGARVWGRAMEEHAPENYPLHGAPDRHGRHWNIGMAHGQVVERRVGQGSSPITKAEIRASGFDYLALGHVHVWADHSAGDTVAYYCGSPVAHFADAGGGKVAVVTLCPEAGVRVASRQVSRFDEQEQKRERGFGNGFPW